MAQIPQARTYSQILGTMIGTFISKTGIAKLKTSNPVLSIFESVAQSELRSSSDIFQLLASVSLDNATGVALQRIGLDEGVPILSARAAGGFVTITDTSFTKIASYIYAGLPAPIIGSTALNIADATLFPASGSVYIGRGTPNLEGPVAYASKTDNGSYWTLNLSSGTTRFHNLSESVILSQGGDRTVTAGSIVQTPQASTTFGVKFRTQNSVVLPSGETTVENVYVVSQRVGIIGNVGVGDIKEFASPPFVGATVTNQTAFTNGREVENDDDYRNRIRIARQTRTKGTKLTLTSSVLGLFSQTENKSIVSSSYVTRLGVPDTLYIDDGSGYEETTEGVAQDIIVASAEGGEQYFEVDSALPVAKAFLQTSTVAPYALTDGAALSVLVGDRLSTHYFSNDDFRNILAATSFEVSASINGNGNLLFSARTSENGTKVSIFAKSPTFEYLQIEPIANNANDILSFPLNLAETIRLFKNDRLLTKDGAPAITYSNIFGQWGALLGDQTLTVAVDFTPAVTYTFTDTDFVVFNTGYTTVGNNSLQAWVQVLNGLIPGLTFSVQGPEIQVVSNKGNSALAAVDIQGGTLVSNGVFTTILVQGRNNDYAFDRNIGQIKLTEPLLVGDTLIAGSAETRAFIESDVLPPTTLAADGKLWLGIDSEGYQTVTTGINNTSALDFTLSTGDLTPNWGYLTRISSVGNVFSNVQAGDLAILWDPAFDASLIGAWRVVNAADDYIEIAKQNAPYKRKNATSTVLLDGRVLVVGGYATAMLGSPLGNEPVFYQTLSSAEIYDPVAQTWVTTGRMNEARGEHTATLLADGRVLVVGGSTIEDLNSRTATLASAEIYDPNTELWTQVAVLPVNQQRYGHVANLLTAGPNANKVLVVGGNNGTIDLATAYLFDPIGSTFAATASMVTARLYAASCALPGGDILVVGGYSAIATAERYSAAAGTWSAASNVAGGRGRFGGAMEFSATSGFAEFYGGHDDPDTDVASDTNLLDRYDPGANTWAIGADSTEFRSFMPWVQTSTGLFATYGGFDTDLSVEVYDSGANTWSTATAPPLQIINDHFTLGALLPGDLVLFSHGAHAHEDNYNFGAATYATSEVYDVGGDTWASSDVALAPVVLTNGGLSVVRSLHRATPVTVPAGANYTATSLAVNLNTQLTAAFADTYKTNQLRLHTDTFDAVSDIGLMAANVDGQLLDLPVSNAVSSIVGANGSVESSTSEVSFPYKLNLPVSGQTGDIVDLLFTTSTLQSFTDTSLNVLFSKKQTVLETETLLSLPPYTPTTILNYGSSEGFYAPVRSQILNGAVELRTVPELPVLPDEPANAMFPYRFTWQDLLAALIDKDVASKNYEVPMGRKLLPVGGVYSSTPAFTDGGNGGASLGAAFGYSGVGGGFNFDDFAIAMHSRLLSDPGDITRRILWRWNRIGSDGDNVRFEYVLADGPDATPVLNLDTTTQPILQVQLGSGSIIPLINMNSATSLGIAVTAISSDIAVVMIIANLTATSGEVTSNVATITLTLPAGIADHGLVANDGFYYSGDTGAVFPAGKYKVTARTATTISFVFVTPDFAATPLVNATVSKGTVQADFTGLAVNDLFRIGANTTFVDPFQNRTYRIAVLSAAKDYFIAQARATGFSVLTTVFWGAINSITNAFGFSNAADTATTLAANFTDTGVTATVTGSGVGIINQPTFEFEADGTFYYTFTDGVKYVKTTNIPVVVGNYSFDFKDPITASLASNSDWANEDVYIIPVTAQNCKDWLASTAISGLGNTCDITRSTRGTKIQIATHTPGTAGSVEILGGTANNSTVTAVGEPIFNSNEGYIMVTTADSDLAGFTAGSALRATNTQTMARHTPFNFLTVISNVFVDGQIYLDTGTFGVFNKGGELAISFQKLGDFMLASLQTPFFQEDSFPVFEGDWISIQGTPLSGDPASSANNGLFRIIKTDQTASVLYYNPSGVEETNKYAWITAVGGVVGYTIPGDILNISTTFLGNGNMGSRPILSIGKAFANSTVGGLSRAGVTVTVTTLQAHGLKPGDYVKLSPGEDFSAEGYKLVVLTPDSVHFTYTEAGTAGLNTLPQTWTGLDFQNDQIAVLDTTLPTVSYAGVAALALEYLKFNFLESVPATYYKFIKNVVPGLADPLVGPALILTNSDYGEFISESAGTVLEPLGKFNFPTTISYGLDGYARSTGLIAEASKVLYGDPSDTATFPGVVAAGNSVEISGPLVKRIFFGASIRVQSGVNAKSIITKVKSAVAGVINASGVGEDIAFSDIIEAMNRVIGVTAVVVLYPTYNSLHDVIKVQNFEKALVLDAQNDVEITLLSA